MDSLGGSPLSSFANDENYASEFDYSNGNFEHDEKIDDLLDGIPSPVNEYSLADESSISRSVARDEYCNSDYDNASGYSEFDDQIDDSLAGNLPLKNKTPFSRSAARDEYCNSDYDNASGYSEFDDQIDDSLAGNLPLKKKTPFSRSVAQDKDYIKDLWINENAKKVGFNNKTGKWTGNKAPELGGQTDYGPGLKLKYKSGGYSQSEIDSALTSKIEEIETKLRQDVQKHGKSYDNLSKDQKRLLVDYSYNTGDAFKKFPKFSKAVVEGDVKKMSAEYKRSWKDKNGVRKELTGRNKWTKSIIDNM